MKRENKKAAAAAPGGKGWHPPRLQAASLRELAPAFGSQLSGQGGHPACGRLEAGGWSYPQPQLWGGTLKVRMTQHQGVPFLVPTGTPLFPGRILEPSFHVRVAAKRRHGPEEEEEEEDVRTPALKFARTKVGGGLRAPPPPQAPA